MDLNNYGFVEVGKWELKESLKSGITFNLHEFKEYRVVYAFMIDDVVKYVGVCESNTTTLEDRMGTYKNLQRREY